MVHTYNLRILESLGEEDPRFKVSLGYTVSLMAPSLSPFHSASP